MAAAWFAGGGSMDGAVLELPAHVTGIVTTERDGGRSYYVVDDQAATCTFAGLNEQGRDMGKIMRQFTEAARAEREAIAAASAAVGCSACGRTFGSPGAHGAAHDGRCLPDSAIESMLVNISGVWCWRGSDVSRR